MVIRLFRGGSKLDKNEIKMLNEIYSHIKNMMSDIEEILYCFIGFDCHNPVNNTKSQIDALLIKRNAIINVEIKNINVHSLFIDKQGRLYDKHRKDYVHGERKLSSVAQVERQNQAIQSFIFHYHEDLGYKFIKSPNDIHVGGFLVLNQLSQVQIDGRRHYLRVIDKSSFVIEMEKYYGKDFNDKNKIMDLHPEFGKKLAGLLDLEEIDEHGLFNVSTLKDHDNKVSKYLAELAHQCFDINYVNRLKEEEKVLNNFNTIITGAPGSGKSSLVKYIVYNQARNHENSKNNVPCLINLNAATNIEKRFYGLLSKISKSYVNELLENGRLWIFFDGVDEMVNFRENLSSLIDFINMYPNNRYTLTVRRENFDNDLYQSEFAVLKEKQNVYQPFTEIRLGELTSTQTRTLIERISDKEEKYIERFDALKKQLPDSNPLTVKMAMEILKAGVALEYENIGKFYDAYFHALFNREIARDKKIGSAGKIYLFEILEGLGYKALKEGISSFGEKEIIFQIRDITGGDSERYFDLIINAEILVLDTSSIEGDDMESLSPRYKFNHQSFLDYFVARSLINKIESFKDIIEEIPGDDRNVSINSMLMFCGIKDDAKLLEELFEKWIDNELLQLAVDCWQNSSIKPVKIVEKFEVALRQAWFNPELGPVFIFKNILRYGHDFGLHKFLDVETKKDLFLSIDWEVIKHYRLNFSDTDKKLLKTYRGAKQLNEGILGKSYYPGVKNSYLSLHTSAYNDYLGLCLDMQNEKGYQLYYDLINAEDLTPFCSAITDISLSGDVRANIIYLAIEFIEDNHMKGMTSQSLFKELDDNKLMYDNESEYYNWMIVTLFYEWCDIEYDNDREKDIINMFWNKYSPCVQLKMVRAYENRFSNTFLMDVLNNYTNDELFDYERMKHLADLYFVSTFSAVFHGTDYFAATIDMIDFKEDTNEIIIKCAALVRLAEIGDKTVLDYAAKFIDSDNEKLSNVAQWILQQYVIRDGNLVELPDKRYLY